MSEHCYFVSAGELRTIAGDDTDPGAGTDEHSGAGVGVGTRHVLRNTVALRYEVQYVRWFGREFDQASQIEFLLNVGAVLGGK